MNNYELLLVLPSTLAETEVSPLVEQVKGTIEKNGGTNLEIGEVEIILKADQRTGKLTRGIVAEILTSSSFHPHGIKVRLTSGAVGRVQNIV